METENWNEIIDTCNSYVERLAHKYKKTGEQDIIYGDVLYEVTTAILKNSGVSKGKRWLTTIIWNSFWNYCRKESYWCNHRKEKIAIIVPLYVVYGEEKHRDVMAVQSRVILRWFMKSRLRKLPKRERYVLKKYYYEDQSAEKIAGTMGVTRQMVSYIKISGLMKMERLLSGKHTKQGGKHEIQKGQADTK